MLGALKIFAKHVSAVRRGYKHWQFADWNSDRGFGEKPDDENALWRYFKNHKTGRGIWKWNHYFEIYDRHFRRFQGQNAHVLEIGIYSGGSLEMWRNYFGPHSHIFGVDIATTCKAYEDENVRLFIGDQADRNFWQRFRSDVPLLDIVIDDGGHLMEQQIVTLEELLPHIRPGGVYLCEDIVCPFNEFSSYIFGMAQNLNARDGEEHHLDDRERRMVFRTRALQGMASVHLYPFVTVIEKNRAMISELVAPKHGTEWEPHLR